MADEPRWAFLLVLVLDSRTLEVSAWPNRGDGASGVPSFGEVTPTGAIACGRVASRLTASLSYARARARRNGVRSSLKRPERDGSAARTRWRPSRPSWRRRHRGQHDHLHLEHRHRSPGGHRRPRPPRLWPRLPPQPDQVDDGPTTASREASTRSGSRSNPLATSFLRASQHLCRRVAGALKGLPSSRPLQLKGTLLVVLTVAALVTVACDRDPYRIGVELREDGGLVVHFAPARTIFR